MGVEPDHEKLNQMEQATAQKLNASATALFGTARLWDDGLIDPRESRQLLGFLFSVCMEGQSRKTQTASFGVARF